MGLKWYDLKEVLWLLWIGLEVGKIRNLLQSEIMASGLTWWLWRWRDVDRFGRYLELKGVGVVA